MTVSRHPVSARVQPDERMDSVRRCYEVGRDANLEDADSSKGTVVSALDIAQTDGIEILSDEVTHMLGKLVTLAATR